MALMSLNKFLSKNYNRFFVLCHLFNNMSVNLYLSLIYGWSHLLSHEKNILYIGFVLTNGSYDFECNCVEK